MADSTYGGNGNGKPFRQYQNDPFDSTNRKDPARDIPGMPPNLGRWAVPQIWTFQGLVSSIAKTYRNPDEAVKHSLDNARFMRQDIGIMECLESRMRSVALLDWHVEIDGPDLPYHKALQERLTSILKRTPRFTQYRYQLLEALWYGRYAIQHRYEWKITPEGRDLVIKEWHPINGDKLVFRQDDGSDDHPLNQIGVRVGAQFKPNDIIEGRVVVPTESGLATFLAPYERNMVALHRHLIEDASYETPFDSGSVHGIGIRSRIYWEWFQKQELLALFMEYLERAALGFEIWYYPDGNDKAYRDMKAAAENRNGRKTILMFPKPLGDDQMAFGVEHIEPNPAGAESFKDVLQGYFGHRIKRYILGQILTSEAEATGLGSGVADLHLQTMLDIIKFDATNLEETITRETLEPLKIWNDKNAHNVDVRFVIQTQQPDVDKKLQAYEAAWNMGARLKESDVMDAIGASLPEYDEPVLQNPTLQAQQLQNDMMQQQMQMQAMGLAPPPGAAPPPGEEEQQGEEGIGEDPTQPNPIEPEQAEPAAAPAPEPGAIVPGAGLSNTEIGAGVGHAKNIKQQLVQGLRAYGYRYSKQGDVARYMEQPYHDPFAEPAPHPEHAVSDIANEHLGDTSFDPSALSKPRIKPKTKSVRFMQNPKPLPKVNVPEAGGRPTISTAHLREKLAMHQPTPIQYNQTHPEYNHRMYKKVVNKAAHEAHWQMHESPKHGAHRWYSHGISDAIEASKDHLPEIADPHLPGHRNIHLAYTAILSPQARAEYNWRMGMTGTAHMLDTHDGKSAPKFPTHDPFTGEKFGSAAKDAGIHGLNHLIKEHWDKNAHIADPHERRERTFQDAFSWLNTEHDPAELYKFKQRATHTDENGQEKHVWLSHLQGADREKLAQFKPRHHGVTLKGEPSHGANLFGQKIGSFFRNIRGDAGLNPEQKAEAGKDVTIDSWMARHVARMFGHMNDERRHDSTGLPSHVPSGDYPHMQRYVQDVANHYNKKYKDSEPVDPLGMQALQWFFEQGLYKGHGYDKADPTFFHEGAQKYDRVGRPRRPGLLGGGQSNDRRGKQASKRSQG
jgi:phage gp29-like protein